MTLAELADCLSAPQVGKELLECDLPLLRAAAAACRELEKWRSRDIYHGQFIGHFDEHGLCDATDAALKECE